MYTKQKFLSSAILVACGAMSPQTHAAFPVDAVLNFTDSVYGCWINNTLTANSPTLVGNTWTCPNSSEVAAPLSTSSYFAMDLSGNGKLAGNERIGMQRNQGIRLTISGYPNVTQLATGSHNGFPNGTETPSIDAPWAFYGNTGMHLTQSPVTVVSNDDVGNVVLEFAGWKVAWNKIEDGQFSTVDGHALHYIPMGGCSLSACNDGNPATVTPTSPDTDGGTTSTLTCYSDAARTVVADCSLGSYFLLSHSAHVPDGDDSGFGNVLYGLQLVGQIGGFNTPPVTTAIPDATAATGGAGVCGSSTTIDLKNNVTDPLVQWTNSVRLNANTATPIITNPSASIAANCSPTTVTANNDGTVSFPGCTAGTYTFEFAFNDGYETSNASLVTVTTTNDPPPTANNDDFNIDGSTPTTLNILTNDIDCGGNLNTGSVVIVSNGTHGTATVVDGATDTISYTANAGYSGTDTFTYRVFDTAGSPQQDDATVTVTVNAYNAPATDATFAAGSIATAAGSTTGIVTMAQIGTPDHGTYPEDDITQSCIGGCFDFVLSGVTSGGTASVVLPLSTAIPDPAPGNSIKYRKLINGSWRDFDVTTDTMQSALGTVSGNNVTCPPAGDSSYHGLTTGDQCLVLTITDGGPNDADGLANGSISDPGGLAEITRASGSDGCSMTGNNSTARDHADWALLAGFMAMLGWFGFKRRKA